jgi:hypothetical protein
MAPVLVHLPNGQSLTVTPVFSGFFFKSNELSTHHTVFPPGWTIILQSEDDGEAAVDPDHLDITKHHSIISIDGLAQPKKPPHRFRQPTLHGDSLYISSISQPSTTEFRPASSPTRQIAMMLWATLYWYFHQPEPPMFHLTEASLLTPDAGKPRADWRVYVRQEGIFRGRNVLQKLERMGLICSEDSSVGLDSNDSYADAWKEMFVSRRTFWQLDPRIFLFTLTPIGHSPLPGGSPYTSRPPSPSPGDSQASAGRTSPKPDSLPHNITDVIGSGLWSPATTGPGPFQSSSHLPTYFPPAPLQYTFSGNVRHPIRPRPPRQGEIFYSRYIPSFGQYLSFRVLSLSPKPLPHHGPTSLVPALPTPPHLPPTASLSDPLVSSASILNLNGLSDTELLHRWMNDPRVSTFWGMSGPIAVQRQFLEAALSAKHSFPAFGCWDGQPFGYFEIYWVKEDQLGRYLDNGGELWDRGFHALVGEQEFRGPDRVIAWLSALTHYCWLADMRTNNVFLEPRIDNKK